MKIQFSYCPKCGQPLVEKQIEGVLRHVCGSCGFVFYRNPAPTVTVLAVNEKDEVLLVKRAHEPMKDWWTLPGGFIDAEERAESAAKRETLEEAGIAVDLLRVIHLDLLDYPDQGGAKKILEITFLAKPTGGMIRAGDDAADARWVSLARLPPLATGEKAIALWREAEGKRS